MARNKQKKKNVSGAGNRGTPPEGRDGQRNGASSASRIAGREGLEAASGETMRRSGRKASSQASHVKYQKRYDYLLTSEMVSGHEVRVSESPSPSKLTRRVSCSSRGVLRVNCMPWGVFPESLSHNCKCRRRHWDVFDQLTILKSLKHLQSG